MKHFFAFVVSEVSNQTLKSVRKIVKQDTGHESREKERKNIVLYLISSAGVGGSVA